MSDLEKKRIDEGLQGNEKIESAIKALQQADGQMRLQAIKTDDGSVWWSAFTSFEEEVRGSDSVMSTFLADIEQLFHMAINEEQITGVILNPWNATLMLNKRLIRIVLGETR